MGAFAPLFRRGDPDATRARPPSLLYAGLCSASLCSSGTRTRTRRRPRTRRAARPRPRWVLFLGFREQSGANNMAREKEGYTARGGVRPAIKTHLSRVKHTFLSSLPILHPPPFPPSCSAAARRRRGRAARSTCAAASSRRRTRRTTAGRSSTPTTRARSTTRASTTARSRRRTSSRWRVSGVVWLSFGRAAPRCRSTAPRLNFVPTRRGSNGRGVGEAPYDVVLAPLGGPR